jgi:hypothetical protein
VNDDGQLPCADAARLGVPFQLLTAGRGLGETARGLAGSTVGAIGILSGLPLSPPRVVAGIQRLVQLLLEPADGLLGLLGRAFGVAKRGPGPFLIAVCLGSVSTGLSLCPPGTLKLLTAGLGGGSGGLLTAVRRCFPSPLG